MDGMGTRLEESPVRDELVATRTASRFFRYRLMAPGPPRNVRFRAYVFRQLCAEAVTRRR